MVLTIISKNDQVKLPFTDQRFSDALVNPDTLRVFIHNDKALLYHRDCKANPFKGKNQ